MMTNTGADIIANIMIESEPGVCPPGEDTITLARTASRFPRGRALDMGSGTGYIGIYLAKQGFQIDATDISEEALRNTVKNARRNNVVINAYYSSLFDQVNGAYDLIVFNPPRIPQAGGFVNHVGSFVRRHRSLVILSLPFVKWFFGGERLSLIISFIRESHKHLRTGGRLLLHLSPEEIQRVGREIQGFGQLDFLEETPESQPGSRIVSIQFSEGAHSP